MKYPIKAASFLVALSCLTAIAVGCAPAEESAPTIPASEQKPPPVSRVPPPNVPPPGQPGGPPK